jgi:rhamnosyltransferase
MSERSVCGVIVTYHPNAEMLENIPRVRSQVNGLVIVDNGSDEDELTPLRSASSELEFHLLENGDNLGIAEALNRGVMWAKDKGFPWVILFDQDSKITDSFVQLLMQEIVSHPEGQRIASMHPKYVDMKTLTEAKVLRAKDGGPVKSMTSGALMPAWIFDKVGYFASEYFIVEVDSEYCYRIRAAGFLVADSQHASLLHSVGTPTTFAAFGFRCRPTNHSPTRRYYMSRNRVAVYRKYFRVFPEWVLQSMYETFRETIKCFLTEQFRIRKFRNFILGTWDGLTGRMGRRDGV